MPDLLYPYLVGVVSTVVVLLAALWSFIVCYRRAIDYARKEERLPLAARWEDLSEKVGDLEEERDRLRDEIRQATYTIEEAARAQEFLEQHQAELEQAKAERQQLEQDRADLIQVREELADAHQRLDALEKDRAKAEFHWMELEERSKALDQKIEEQMSLLDREQNRLDKIREDAAAAAEQLNDTRRQLGDVGEAAAQAQRRLEALERDIRELTKQHDALKQENNLVQDETAQLKATAAKLREQTASLEGQEQALTSRVDKLRKTTEKLDPSEIGRNKGLAELWQPVIDLSEYTDPTSELSEHEALERVRNYLRALGLRFPKRAVHAFHTSLKVARDTPLLVLAGISGTGKSLLPRRYAEAMGMHFLSVPVQPRWDGPQDLLGFFNYLENRYKATELIRALIQTDPIPRSWLPDDYGDCFADQRMLIVLLDEMNLARVEYYFSEFLSRLETRRDIVNLDYEADRIKAEINLDIGRFGEEVACRVFVDTNVLFVGTINEDESKLALSDMVIDRANVIRFGRPLSLTLQAGDGQQAAAKLRAKEGISKDTWSDWVRGWGGPPGCG